jgi:hypothetical protein
MQPVYHVFSARRRVTSYTAATSLFGGKAVSGTAFQLLRIA